MDTTVKEEILRQLKACQEGDFTEEELESAKQSLISHLQSTHDSPGAIEGYYAAAAISGLQLTPEDYIRRIRQTDAKAVAEAAATVRLHTTYFLRGAV